MTRVIITDEARELHRQFTAVYGYVTVSTATVQQFINACKSKNIDLLYDYVLSQGLAEEVEE